MLTMQPTCAQAFVGLSSIGRSKQLSAAASFSEPSINSCRIGPLGLPGGHISILLEFFILYLYKESRGI